jgi:hypothetical protein
MFSFSFRSVSISIALPCSRSSIIASADIVGLDDVRDWCCGIGVRRDIRRVGEDVGSGQAEDSAVDANEVFKRTMRVKMKPRPPGAL